MNALRRVCSGVFKHEGEARPQTVNIQGIELHRFMDFFYIEVEADELDPAQVEAVCRERAADPRSFVGVNSEVKAVFQRFLKESMRQPILEIGAGDHPIFTADEVRSLGLEYVTSDADPEYKTNNQVFSGSESHLAFPPEYFGIAVALFVLHFRFYRSQIDELFRCLRPDGLFLANIYRRSEAARKALINEFSDAGFMVELLDDPKSLCQNHKYLIAGRSAMGVEVGKTLLTKIVNHQIGA